jgi:outer membrane receptor for ferrienterochelin and colicins
MKSVVKFLIFLILISNIYYTLFSNNIYILDQSNKTPLQNATVKITCIDNDCKDSTIILKTNKFGFVKNPLQKKAIIKISFIGYESIEDTIESTFRELKYFMTPISIMLNEVVTTGQFIPTTVQQSVFPVNVLNKERISSQAAVNLRDVLATEMNMRIGVDNILGSNISIDGISGQNVKIMIDGVPVIGRLNGNIDLNQLNLNNADRIEIIEGPMSAIYGTDALGGVINIISKDIKNQFSASLNSYYESIGVANFDADVTASFDNYRLLLNGGRYFFAGFSNSNQKRYKDWKPKEQYFGNFSIAKNFGDIELKYSANYFNEFILNRGEPRLPYGESAFDDKYFTHRLGNSIFIKGKIGENKYIDFVANYSNFKRRKNTFFKNLITLEEIITSDSTAQDTSVFNSVLFRGTFSRDAAIKMLSYQVGFDVNLEDAGGKRIENLTQNIGDYAAFLSFQFKPYDNLVIQPALRFIYNTRYDAPIIPSLNLKWNLNDKFIFRLSYARGFRAPSLKELFFNFVDINHNILGKSDLKAEKSHSFNTIFTYQILSNDYLLKLEPRFFYNHIDDLITLAAVKKDEFSYLNIGQYKTLGGDVNFSLYSSSLTFNTGFSYIGRYNKPEDYLIPDEEFSFSPEFKTNIIYEWKSFDIKLSFFYKYTGKQPGFTLTTEKTPLKYFIDDYHILDFTLTYNFSLTIFPDLQFNILTGGKNLLNVKNINQTAPSIEGFHSSGSTTLPIAWGRTFFASLKINFN